MDEMTQKILVCFLVFSSMGWVLLFTGISSRLSKRRREISETDRTEGVIAEYVRHETPAKGRPHVTWRPMIEFTAYGQQIRKEYENTLDPEKHPAGETVEVVFDPNQPASFHLAMDTAYQNGGSTVMRVGLIWILASAAITFCLAFFVGGWRPDFRAAERDLRRLASGSGKPAATAPVTGAENSFEYRVKSDLEAEITGYYGNDEKLVIPALIGGRVVSGFSGTPFARTLFLKDLTVPGTVRTIPMLSFGASVNLQKVTLKDGVRGIGSKAFYNSRGLTDVTLPASLTAVADDAFPEGCAAVFHVPAGSAAEEYCRKKGFRTEVSGDSGTEV